MVKSRRIDVAVVLCAWLAGCGDSTPPDNRDATFTRLQTTVFAQSCAVGGCHVGSTVATSGNLSLAADAFENLVNVAPTNLNAKQDGLRRVVPGWPDSSLLYLKLLSPPRSAQDYGNLMPSGGTPLSAGQVEYVLQWIAAGAPKTGAVAAPALLSDVTPQTSAVFQPLPPPPPGAGVQLRVDPFVVKQQFERELFVYRSTGNASEIYVKRIEFRMRPNSHHFVLYSFTEGVPPNVIPEVDVVRDIRRPDGSLDIFAMRPMAYHVFFGGSMQTEFAYDFPPGVALLIPANSALDMNLHYANRTDAPVTGEALVNLYTADPASVTYVARPINMPNTSIALPANQRTTLERTFLVNERKTVIALTSHMHRLGETFVIRIVGGPRDGETVYESTDWEHPQLLFLATPIVLEAGQGLKSIITWNNTTSQTVGFGLQSTDEMGIIFGYYY